MYALFFLTPRNLACYLVLSFSTGDVASLKARASFLTEKLYRSTVLGNTKNQIFPVWQKDLEFWPKISPITCGIMLLWKVRGLFKNDVTKRLGWGPAFLWHHGISVWQRDVLYISTRVWVLHTSNAGWNMHFIMFLCLKAKKMQK